MVGNMRTFVTDRRTDWQTDWRCWFHKDSRRVLIMSDPKYLMQLLQADHRYLEFQYSGNLVWYGETLYNKLGCGKPPQHDRNQVVLAADCWADLTAHRVLIFSKESRIGRSIQHTFGGFGSVPVKTHPNRHRRVNCTITISTSTLLEH